MSAHVEDAVRERYSEGAKAREEELCCPVSYDPRYLDVIPSEVIAKDYGCGDPTRYLAEGETVLDLGSGAGKLCFIAAQIVGSSGRVIGVDFNDDMLEVARRNAPRVAERIGYDNVEFHKGKIQDLSLDRDRLEAWIARNPVENAADLARMESKIRELRVAHPLVADESVDVVVSNCVLNLVSPEDKSALFREIHRVLKRGGRAVISDIVSDEDVPQHMQDDPDLWSGCISGAFRDDRFLEAFENAGFYGITIASLEAEPWRVVEDIEFRSLTVVAYKGKEGPCLDQKHAVIYNGPFRSVTDDDGHVYRRGARMAVCEKTFRILSRPPYRDHVTLVEPHEPVSLEDAPPFACKRGTLRHPRETKGAEYEGVCIDPEGNCC